MPSEHSAGAIIYRLKDGKVLYLLLEYRPDYWGFAKGIIEKSESAASAAAREVQEETGLAGFKLIDGFKDTEKYVYTRKGQRIFKTVTYFLAEAPEGDVKVSWEHSGYAWLPYEEALKKTTFAGGRRILQKAAEFLEGNL